jgi:hypothetical protein
LLVQLVSTMAVDDGVAASFMMRCCCVRWVVLSCHTPKEQGGATKGATRSRAHVKLFSNVGLQVKGGHRVGFPRSVDVNSWLMTTTVNRI